MDMKKWMAKYSPQLILVGVILLIGGWLTLQTPYFLNGKNLMNLLEANSYRLILALGMAGVIASGAIDLSAGAMVSLSGVFMALCMKSFVPAGAAAVLGIFLGSVLGAVNGIIIHFTKINAFIITLATATIYRGISLMITKGIPITKFDQGFLFFGTGKFMGIEVSVWFGFFLILLFVPLMFHTKWGQYIQSLGGNKDALERAGVRSGIYRISVHMVMGMMAAVVAVIITARLNSAEANAGLSMELDAIAAVAMGGTLMSGGRVSIMGTAAAVLLLGLVRNGLTVMSVSSFYQQFVTGILLLAAILFSELRSDRH